MIAHDFETRLVKKCIRTNAQIMKNAQYLFVRINIPQKMGRLLHSNPIVNAKNAQNSERGFVKNGIPTNAIKI